MTEHPCDICTNKKGCDRPCMNGTDCFFESHIQFDRECDFHTCFLNYDGICKLQIYDECGAWKALRN